MNTNQPLSELRCENQWQLLAAMINGVQHLIPNTAPVMLGVVDRLRADHMLARTDAEQFAVDLDREQMISSMHRAESERLAEELDNYTIVPGVDQDMRYALLTQLGNMQANNAQIAELIEALS